MQIGHFPLNGAGFVILPPLSLLIVAFYFCVTNSEGRALPGFLRNFFVRIYMIFRAEVDIYEGMFRFSVTNYRYYCNFTSAAAPRYYDCFHILFSAVGQRFLSNNCCHSVSTRVIFALEVFDGCRYQLITTGTRWFANYLISKLTFKSFDKYTKQKKGKEPIIF